MSFSVQDYGKAAMNSLADGLEFAWKQHKTSTVLTVAWLSWMFSILSAARCTFMTNGQREDLGLLSRSFVDAGGEWLGCVKYGGGDDSAKAKAGRAFGILTVLCTSLSVSCMTTVVLWKPEYPSAVVWKIAHYCLMAAAVSQMLAFLALGSHRCTLGGGGGGGCTLTGVGILAVCNTMLLDLLCFVWFFLPLPSSACLSWWEHTETAVDANATTGQIQARTPSAKNGPTRDNQQPASRRMDTVEEGESVNSTSSQGGSDTSERIDSIQDLTGFRLTTVLLIVVVWIVSLFGVRRCTFLSVVGPADTGGLSLAGLGLYSQSVRSGSGAFLGCVAYPDRAVKAFDGPFRAARAFGAMTALLTTIMVASSVSQLFLERVVRESWYALRFMMPTATCTQLLAFAAFGTGACNLQGGTGCRPGGTGIVVILNIFLMVTLSALVLLITPPRNPVFQILVQSHQEEKPTPRCGSSVGGRATADTAYHTDDVNCRLGPIEEETDDDSGHDDTAASDSVRIETRASQLQRPKEKSNGSKDVASITVKMEYTATEKTTTKIVSHVDGTQTITVTTEEQLDDGASELRDDVTENGSNA